MSAEGRVKQKKLNRRALPHIRLEFVVFNSFSGSVPPPPQLVAFMVFTPFLRSADPTLSPYQLYGVHLGFRGPHQRASQWTVSFVFGVKLDYLCRLKCIPSYGENPVQQKVSHFRSKISSATFPDKRTQVPNLILRYNLP